jgi:hypothetical protein
MALFYGFPLWWALGVANFVFVGFAIPLAIELMTRRGLRAPRGFGLWLGFLGWMLASAAMLWVDAPGAVPGGGLERLLVFGYRASMYIAATVILLYVLNTPERDLPTRRVVRLLGFMFVVTVCGGMLGVVAPGFSFTSLMEMLLPQRLASNGFVNQMVHPAAADVQNVLGYETARPIAPFAFANSWGANFSLYLPFFLLAWLGRGAGPRRWLAPFVLVAGLVPTVYSLNRGLWLALGVGLCYLVWRLAALGGDLPDGEDETSSRRQRSKRQPQDSRGRTAPNRGRGGWLLPTIVACVVVGALVMTFSPLGRLVYERLNAPHSNDRRADLAALTVRAVLEASPVLGFGSTRDVAGNFTSIAGGATPDCPACAVPPMGTQGQLWLVVFSQGLVGLALFLGFFARRFVAALRDSSPLGIAGGCVLVFFGIELLVYDTFDAPMTTVMITLGLLARQADAETATAGVRARVAPNRPARVPRGRLGGARDEASMPGTRRDPVRSPS